MCETVVKWICSVFYSNQKRSQYLQGPDEPPDCFFCPVQVKVLIIAWVCQIVVGLLWVIIAFVSELFFFDRVSTRRNSEAKYCVSSSLSHFEGRSLFSYFKAWLSCHVETKI